MNRPVADRTSKAQPLSPRPSAALISTSADGERSGAAVRERFQALLLEQVTSTLAELRALTEAEAARWSKPIESR